MRPIPATAGAPRSVRPRDELPVPAQERLRGDDRRDLAQRLTAYPNGARCEPSPVVIGQPQALPTQLPPEQTVLFDQLGQGLPLAALQPASQHHQQHLKGRGIDHEQELIARLGRRRSQEVGRLWDRTGEHISVFT